MIALHLKAYVAKHITIESKIKHAGTTLQHAKEAAPGVVEAFARDLSVEKDFKVGVSTYIGGEWHILGVFQVAVLRQYGVTKTAEKHPL